jgi:hypothetical protein
MRDTGWLVLLEGAALGGQGVWPGHLDAAAAALFVITTSD